jgi:hypothetical protein
MNKSLNFETGGRIRFLSNQIRIKSLETSDGGIYSCHFKRTNSTANVKLIVRQYIKGGLDPRSPHGALKLSSLFSFIIFCCLLFYQYLKEEEFDKQ